MKRKERGLQLVIPSHYLLEKNSFRLSRDSILRTREKKHIEESTTGKPPKNAVPGDWFWRGVRRGNTCLRDETGPEPWCRYGGRGHKAGQKARMLCCPRQRMFSFVVHTYSQSSPFLSFLCFSNRLLLNAGSHPPRDDKKKKKQTKSTEKI